MHKITKHIRRWNKWRKRCCNSKFYKFLVLIGIKKSPTMGFVMLPEEKNALYEGLMAGLNGDKR